MALCTRLSGSPVRWSCHRCNNSRSPYVFQPLIGVDTIKAVVDALHAGWLGMGAITQAFEQEVARFLGLERRWVLATNTGTSALHLALLAAGVGPGDEVITPAFN